jgi:very-short-patch-repair endonuclease
MERVQKGTLIDGYSYHRKQYMNVLIYGNEPPRISFIQTPEGGITFKIDNERQIEFDPEKDAITWYHIYSQQKGSLFVGDFPGLSDKDKSIYDKFIAELSEITGSKTERKFFIDYAESVWRKHDSPWDAPALIPQVWVNWIHYDSQDKKRAERVHNEPFRVDFVMKNWMISQHPVIIEIDGPSHFGRHSNDPSGKPILHASMAAYTEHLRKDRWLRKAGWDVYRISSQEINDYDNVDSLFYDVFWCRVDGLPF